MACEYLAGLMSARVGRGTTNCLDGELDLRIVEELALDLPISVQDRCVIAAAEFGADGRKRLGGLLPH